MNSALKPHCLSSELALYILQYFPKVLQVLWFKDMSFCFRREEMLNFILYFTVLGLHMITSQCNSADEKWEEFFLVFVEILTSRSERQKKNRLLLLQTNVNSVSSYIHSQKVKSCWRSSVFNHWIFCMTNWS